MMIHVFQNKVVYCWLDEISNLKTSPGLLETVTYICQYFQTFYQQLIKRNIYKYYII